MDSDKVDIEKQLKIFAEDINVTDNVTDNANSVTDSFTDTQRKILDILEQMPDISQA